jgi:hypothetical protein
MFSRIRVTGSTGTTRNQSHQRCAPKRIPPNSQPQRNARPGFASRIIQNSGTKAKKARKRSGKGANANPPRPTAATARIRALRM